MTRDWGWGNRGKGTRGPWRKEGLGGRPRPSVPVAGSSVRRRYGWDCSLPLLPVEDGCWSSWFVDEEGMS